MAPLGARNPRLQHVRRLGSSRRTRASEGQFLLEGPTLVADALASGVEVVEAYHEPDANAAVVNELSAAGVVVREVHPGVLDAVGDAVTSQGILAVGRIPSSDIGAVPAATPLFVLVGIADPGNAGTVVRVAEAAGFGAVLFTAGSVDPWSPKAVRASAGSMLRVPAISGGEAEAVLDEVRATGRRCVGTRPLDAPDYTEADLPASVAIVLGSEAHGLPASLQAHLDDFVRIPMAGNVESLNVAMAATVLAFEVARRRG
jgi:TrmH family RNA methyltransferase